jgi:indole-3-glycerol phosphate synthase
MSRLAELVEAARADVEDRKRRLAPESLKARLTGSRAKRRLADAIRGPGLSLIAEFKRRSPSFGEIRTGATVAEVVGAYQRGGAAALSVLTDARSFGGSLDDLAEARRASDLPILRKDFIVDPYQVHEAAVSGADAVLLIVAALGDHELSALHHEAGEIGLDCLVEVHDRAELERALAIDAELIGINNRDLTDLTVDVKTAARLLVEVPDDRTVVAESGYERRDQLVELERSGGDAVLIGEAVMRAPDLEAAVRDLVLTP